MMDDAGKCPEQLSAFLDGQLPADQAEAVAAAIGKDPQLRRQAQSLEATRGLLRGVPRESAPPEMLDAILQRVERERLFAQPAHQAAPSPLRWLWRAWAAAVVLLGAGLGITIYHQITRPAWTDLHAPAVVQDDEDGQAPDVVAALPQPTAAPAVEPPAEVPTAESEPGDGTLAMRRPPSDESLVRAQERLAELESRQADEAILGRGDDLAFAFDVPQAAARPGVLYYAGNYVLNTARPEEATRQVTHVLMTNGIAVDEVGGQQALIAANQAQQWRMPAGGNVRFEAAVTHEQLPAVLDDLKKLEGVVVELEPLPAQGGAGSGDPRIAGLRRGEQSSAPHPGPTTAGAMGPSAEPSASAVAQPQAGAPGPGFVRGSSVGGRGQAPPATGADVHDVLASTLRLTDPAEPLRREIERLGGPSDERPLSRSGEDEFRTYAVDRLRLGMPARAGAVATDPSAGPAPVTIVVITVQERPQAWIDEQRRQQHPHPAKGQ